VEGKRKLEERGKLKKEEGKLGRTKEKSRKGKLSRKRVKERD
jgi:hypothetical protein